MNDVEKLLRDYERFTPRNYAIKTKRGRTVVVIEATNAVVAAHRAETLRGEVPGLPLVYEIAEHVGPTNTAWYGHGYFAVREECERFARDSEAGIYGMTEPGCQ